MRFISKSQEPISLRNYKAKPGAIYDGPEFTSVKAQIRDQLLKEQGYLRCYCMKRIENDPLSTSIEHWHCQQRYPQEQLEYRNLLAACDGNKGSRASDQHCDTKKADRDLSFNPSDPAHAPKLRISYGLDGKIFSLDNEFNEQLENVLNLNQHRLVENRKAVVDAVNSALGCRGGTRKRAEIVRIAKKWDTPDNEGKRSQFNGIALFFLEKRLAIAKT